MKLIEFNNKIEVSKVKILNKKATESGLQYDVPDKLKTVQDRYCTYYSASYPGKIIIINPYDVVDFQPTPSAKITIADTRNIYAIIELDDNLTWMKFDEWEAKVNEEMDGLVIKPARPKIFTGA